MDVKDVSSSWLKKTNRHQDWNFCFRNVTHKALSKYSEAFEFRTRLRACLLRTTAVDTSWDTSPQNPSLLSTGPAPQAQLGGLCFRQDIRSQGPTQSAKLWTSLYSSPLGQGGGAGTQSS